jgi:hypothetical protein
VQIYLLGKFSSKGGRSNDEGGAEHRDHMSIEFRKNTIHDAGIEYGIVEL